MHRAIKKISGRSALGLAVFHDISSTARCENNENEDRFKTILKAAQQAREDSIVPALQRCADVLKTVTSADSATTDAKWAWDRLKKHSGQLSVEFCIGYASGYTAKKGAKGLSIFFGGGFILVQCLAHGGYVQVDHEKWRRDAEHLLGFPTSNSGTESQEQTMEHLREAWQQLELVLNAGLPAGSGFLPGLALGFVRG